MADKIQIDNLEDLIRESIGGELVEHTVSSLVPSGAHIGSAIYKVDLKVKKDGKEEQYNAVAKCLSPSTIIQGLFNVQETFKSEIAWYTTVIPTLKKFQRDHGVKKEMDCFQSFYGARISLDPTSEKVDLDGVILTQNLKTLGYYNIDMQDSYDLSTTEAILSDLATFHAVPLAMRLQNPQLFDAKIRPYLPQFGDTEKILEGARTKQIMSVFNVIPECEPIMDRIVKSLDERLEFGGRPLREPWVTVIHMDLWKNNIMVTEGDKPKIIFLDFQFPTLGSPAADLLFLLITSVNFELVQEKFEDLLKFYYNEFIRNLKELGVPTEDYTFEGLLREIETEGRIGEFGHSLGHTVGILMDRPEKKDSISEKEKKEKFTYDIVPNKRQMEKLSWAANMAIKWKWI